ncbi:hypothetical protein ACBI99_41325 [Nonomuraea sp. ATR24]|uniref:hypothetical protein n=1 Tax=Nonomuraea sp. ATR24 TaxID=1676744 RepID=UPI0035C20A98
MQTSTGKPLAVAVALAALLTACTAPAAPPTLAAPAAPAASAAPAAPAGIDQIGAAAGCPRPALQIDAADLRQADCRTARGHYTLVTFTTERGQRDWLELAQMYGGAYLVGERWVVVSTPPLLEGVRAQLGGRIEAAHHH